MRNTRTINDCPNSPEHQTNKPATQILVEPDVVGNIPNEDIVENFSPLDKTVEQFRLSPAALEQIKVNLDRQSYPDAYQIIIDETAATDYDGRKWFVAAASVNEGKGFVSAFIKTYTQIAKLLNNEICQTFSDHDLQQASNEIAKTVLGGIVANAGCLPDFETIMKTDANTAIMTLKLTPIQWAGTPVSRFAGHKGPLPGVAHDWLIVFRSTYHAVLSSIFDGTADHVKMFFSQITNRNYDK
jgi:hypothetical protein